MAYDKKTRTINIGENETPEDFERDMSEYFVHIEEQLAKDFPQAKKSAKNRQNLWSKLRNLSKPTKGGIAFVVFWTAFVIYRTSDYHEVVGFELDRWSEDEFLTNWLGFPIVIAAIYSAVRWVTKDK